MRSASRSERWPLVVVAALGGLSVLHDLLALGLDHLGLIEQLLSPNETSAIGAVLAAVALYSIRLGLAVVGPGLALAAAGWWVLGRSPLGRSPSQLLSVRGAPASDPPPGGPGGHGRRAAHPSGGPTTRP